MLPADHPLRIAARLKLNAGVKPELLTENLVRLRYPREEVAQAISLELAARKLPSAKRFQLLESHKSLLDRLADSSIPLFIGLGITAIGGVLFALCLHAGIAVRSFLTITLLGVIITCYGILNLGKS